MINTEKENHDEYSDGTVAARYNNLCTERELYLDRARLNSELTIPYLMPPEGHSSATKLYTPFQSVGARGINNLASKMVLAFLPPEQNIFAFSVSEAVVRDLEAEAEQTGEQGITIGTIESSLRSLERDILREIGGSNLRMSLFEAFKHLFVVGNILIYAPEESNNIKLFRLDRYVCIRDSLGTIVELITKEELSPASAPKEVIEHCDVESNRYENKNICLYTKVCFNEDINKYEIYQECNGVIIPGTYGTYPKEKLPFICLRNIVVDGENYGRSYTEEYFGDLRSLEGLQKNIVEATAAISKTVWMVTPNSSVKAEHLAKAKNNAIITGNSNDVTVLRSDKQVDLSVAQQTINKIEERLAYAFMLNTAIQRGGDRVTAEEIRYMSKELEDGLGGMFTTLSNELMIPLINIYLDRLTKQKKIPTFPKGLVKPMLTTGLESFGRTNELQKLQMFIKGLVDIQANSYLNMPEVVKRIGNSLNIDMEGLIKSDEQLQAEQQQQQQMAMMQTLGPNAINQIGGIAKEEISGQQQIQQGEI